MKNTRLGRKFGDVQKDVLVKRAPKITNLVPHPAGEVGTAFSSSQGVGPFDGKVRLNKKIKELGLASRRDADKLIEKGLVTVNGKVAEIGRKVKPTDVIEIKNITKIQDNYLYFTFYKPKDVMSHSPQYGEKEVKNFFPEKMWENEGLTIVGRLDKHSEGLMLVTNDKRLVERILDPRFEHERTYEVEVQEKLSNNLVALFKKGFEVRDRFIAKPAKVEIVNPFNLRIVLTEGKKHQIRLMLNELHYTVFNLRRVKILNLTLKNLQPGTFKPIPKPQVQELLQKVGLK